MSKKANRLPGCSFITNILQDGLFCSLFQLLFKTSEISSTLRAHQEALGKSSIFVSKVNNDNQQQLLLLFKASFF